MADKIKGFITVFLNMGKELAPNADDAGRYLAAVKELNNEWIGKIEKDALYHVLLVPTINESSHVQVFNIGGTEVKPIDVS